MHDPPQQDVYPDHPREDVAPHIPSSARSALDVGAARVASVRLALEG